jgi:hypothetical protein
MVSKEHQELRDFIDALRICLGKDPLYKLPEEQQRHRFLREDYGFSSVPDEWFKPIATADLSLHARDESVRLTNLRRALRFETERRRS